MESNDKLKCSQCGATIQLDEMFCRKCGVKTNFSPDSASGSANTSAPGSYGGGYHSLSPNYAINGDNHSEPVDGSIEFPFASIFYILLILLSIGKIITSLGNMPFIFLFNYTIEIIAYMFIVIVLLAKRRGVLLIIAVGALVVAPLMYAIIYYQFILSMLPWDYLLLFGLAVYCEKRKNSLPMGFVPKLWFVPGAFTVLSTLSSLSNSIDYTGWYGGIFILHRSFFGWYIQYQPLFAIVAVFLLGYWISYIYSIKYTPTNATRSDSSHISAHHPTHVSSSARKYCDVCGTIIYNNNIFCPECGNSLTNRYADSGQSPPNMENLAYSKPSLEGDAPSTGYAALSFFFPIVGLILYLVWRASYPQRARSIGRGALLGVAVVVIIYILAFIALSSF